MVREERSGKERDLHGVCPEEKTRSRNWKNVYIKYEKHKI